MPVRANTRRGHGLSERRRRFLIREECMSAREYARLGFVGLSRDEARHRRFLVKLGKKR